jgi:hypothetical protein
VEVNMSEEKIGMYTAEEIYEELANGFLHRSMVDAMYFKIKDLQQKVEQLENIRKETIECIETDSIEINTKEYGNLTVINSDDLLNILNKESDKE